MRRKRIAAIALLASMLVPTIAQAAVKVTFVDPERFSDRDFKVASKRDGILRAFEQYLDRLGATYLKDGQTLNIQVLNIDLAGRYEPWQRHFNDVRIMRDITPPRFKVRYTLKEGGKVLIGGEENVTDMAYLWGQSARISNERFSYEKQMLRDWFRRRFVHLRPPM